MPYAAAHKASAHSLSQLITLQREESMDCFGAGFRVLFLFLRPVISGYPFAQIGLDQAAAHLKQTPDKGGFMQ